MKRYNCLKGSSITVAMWDWFKHCSQKQWPNATTRRSLLGHEKQFHRHKDGIDPTKLDPFQDLKFLSFKTESSLDEEKDQRPSKETHVEHVAFILATCRSIKLPPSLPLLPSIWFAWLRNLRHKLGNHCKWIKSRLYYILYSHAVFGEDKLRILNNGNHD